MNTLIIRPATLSDLPALVAASCALAADTEGRRLAEPVVRRGTQRVLADPHLGRYYVAETAGEVVGQLLITYEVSDWRDGVFWWIQSVYVRPMARKMGVYRALHEYVERAARQTTGVCGLRLYVDRGNTRAQAVYRQVGMRETDYALYELDWSGIEAHGAGR